MNPLYMMTKVNVLSGARRIVYGHATGNVMDQFWRDYIDDDHLLEIQVVKDASMMMTPRPTRHLDAVIAERDQLRDIIEHLLATDRMIDLFDDADAKAQARTNVIAQVAQRYNRAPHAVR